jgi:recombination protein RecT
VSDESNTAAPWMKVIAKAEPRFNEIAEADGNLVMFKREAMFAHQAFEKPGSDYLRTCDPASLYNAIINVASVGLTLSPAEKLAYLVPRAEGKGKDRKVLCCLDISYRGLKKIAEDSGSVLTAVAEIVREGDEFEWIDKLTRPVHKFDVFATAADRGPVRGAYCMAVLHNGITQVEALPMEQLNKIRACSKGESGPWIDWPEEMMKKSAVRRASKMWPHSPRMQVANSILDEHQGLVDLPAPVLIPGPVETPTDTAPAERRGEPGEAPPAGEAPPEKPGKAAPNADKPILPGQVKILRARMKSASLAEDKVVEKFGAVDTWKFSDFERIQSFIAGGGK